MNKQKYDPEIILSIVESLRLRKNDSKVQLLCNAYEELLRSTAQETTELICSHKETYIDGASRKRCVVTGKETKDCAVMEQQITLLNSLEVFEFSDESGDPNEIEIMVDVDNENVNPTLKALGYDGNELAVEHEAYGGVFLIDIGPIAAKVGAVWWSIKQGFALAKP